MAAAPPTVASAELTSGDAMKGPLRTVAWQRTVCPSSTGMSIGMSMVEPPALTRGPWVSVMATS